MTFDEVTAAHDRLGPIAFLATVAGDGAPHAVPIHVEVHDGRFFAAIGIGDVKARNLAADPRLCLAYQVAETTSWDQLMVYGTGRVLTDSASKRRLWGIFSYDLDGFEPGGPDGSPGTGILEIIPHRAVLLLEYGMRGRAEWRAADRAGDPG